MLESERTARGTATDRETGAIVKRDEGKREREREREKGRKEKEKGKKRSRMAGWRTEMGRAEREIKKIEGCDLSRRR